MGIIERLDRARSAINVLQHPFYERWSAGQLSAGELRRYAGEYRHAVAALAETSDRAALQADDRHLSLLRLHAAEEHAHIDMWDRFSEATGAIDSGSPPLATTRRCVESWTAGRNLLDRLAVLYVIEAGQPQVSQTKLTGLVDHYGYPQESPATEYFRVHQHMDVHHARQAGDLILEFLGDVADTSGCAERMLCLASAALGGNWLLLDGVEAARSTVQDTELTSAV